MPNKKKGSDLIPVSESRFEGIQLCLINAKRLLEDSDNVSIDTAVGLLELSLEELSKGFMLIFRGTTDKKNYDKQAKSALESLEESKLKESDKEGVREFYSKVGFKLFEELTIEQFESHQHKLEYLGHLIDLVVLLLLPTLKMSNISKALNKYFGGFVSIYPKEIMEINSEFVESLKRLNTIHIKELKDVRERGFYVGYSSGHYFYPSSNELYLNQLEALSDSFVAMMDGMLKAYS